MEYRETTEPLTERDRAVIKRASRFVMVPAILGAAFIMLFTVLVSGMLLPVLIMSGVSLCMLAFFANKRHLIIKAGAVGTKLVIVGTLEEKIKKKVAGIPSSSGRGGTGYSSSPEYAYYYKIGGQKIAVDSRDYELCVAGDDVEIHITSRKGLLLAVKRIDTPVPVKKGKRPK